MEGSKVRRFSWGALVCSESALATASLFSGECLGDALDCVGEALWAKVTGISGTPGTPPVSGSRIKRIALGVAGSPIRG